jgi:glycosyltransferase involved in cell wall biosynthesis
MNMTIASLGGGPIHVLHLRDSERLCGPGKIIRDCIRANPDREIRFRVAAFESAEENAFLSALAPLVPVVGVPGAKFRLVEAAHALTGMIQAEKVDLLHTHDVKANAIGLIAARRAKVPILATVHGRIPNSAKARLYASIDHHLLRRMDLVFAVSAIMARQLASKGIPGERLVLARNGIMLDEHPFGLRSSRLREEGHLREGDVAIGHVGRISPEKGVVTLIVAFSRLADEFPSSRLVLAGDGQEIGAARQAASAPRLRGRVVFLGYRADVEAVYGAIDLFVLNSTTEGLPNAVLEAMAFGVPVVATAVGGTPELVRDGETGLLVPPSDPTALANAIRAVLRDRDAAAERARRARALVEREFDMRRLSHSINVAYRRAIVARRRE